ncbi:MAG: polysaccharide ABC transporter ATP-binding protein [Turneriella sp.]
MSVVIKVENLSKEYRLGSLGHGALFRDIQSVWARYRGKTDPNSPIIEDQKDKRGAFWALRDVSFSINQGDVLGIVGRNGAGKSTLLKILSRVTSPSQGRVKIRGRMASLLEVGTGFHPELTGRENIFLNGAILGMSSKQIKARMDEIVLFADIQAHMDTPVKRYSSGMYVRLAFAVAAHLDSDILVVDEVLAVGDAEFQRKCIGKMEAVGKAGRTVIFVSHNLGAVNRFCPNSLYLEHGQIAQYGPTPEVIENYLRSGHSGHSGYIVFDNETKGSILLLSAQVTGLENTPKEIFRSDEDIRFILDYRVLQRTSNQSIYFEVLTREQESLWHMCDWEAKPRLLDNRPTGIWTATWVLPANFLKPGTYYARFGTHSEHKDLQRPEPFSFEITAEGTNRPRFKHWGVSGGPISYPMKITGVRRKKKMYQDKKYDV